METDGEETKGEKSAIGRL